MLLNEIIHGDSAISRGIWKDTRRTVRDQRVIKVVPYLESEDLSLFIESKAPTVNLPYCYGLGYRVTEETVMIDGRKIKQRYITYIQARR